MGANVPYHLIFCVVVHQVVLVMKVIYRTSWVYRRTGKTLKPMQHTEDNKGKRIPRKYRKQTRKRENTEIILFKFFKVVNSPKQIHLNICCCFWCPYALTISSHWDDTWWRKLYFFNVCSFVTWSFQKVPRFSGMYRFWVWNLVTLFLASFFPSCLRPFIHSLFCFCLLFVLPASFLGCIFACIFVDLFLLSLIVGLLACLLLFPFLLTCQKITVSRINWNINIGSLWK